MHCVSFQPFLDLFTPPLPLCIFYWATSSSLSLAFYKLEKFKLNLDRSLPIQHFLWFWQIKAASSSLKIEALAFTFCWVTVPKSPTPILFFCLSPTSLSLDTILCRGSQGERHLSEQSSAMLPATSKLWCIFNLHKLLDSCLVEVIILSISAKWIIKTVFLNELGKKPHNNSILLSNDETAFEVDTLLGRWTSRVRSSTTFTGTLKFPGTIDRAGTKSNNLC